MRKALTLAGLMFAAGPVPAQMSASELADTVQANFDQIATLSCTLTVTATVHYARPGVPDASTVSVTRYWLKRPGKMRVEPLGGPTMICDGVSAWRVDADGTAMRLAGPLPGLAVPPAELWSLRSAVAGLRLVVGTEGALTLLEAWPGGSGSAGWRTYGINETAGCADTIVLRDPRGSMFGETVISYTRLGGVLIPHRYATTYRGAANTTTLVGQYGDVRVNQDIPDGSFAP